MKKRLNPSARLRFRPSATSAVLCALLSACGGGGDTTQSGILGVQTPGATDSPASTAPASAERFKRLASSATDVWTKIADEGDIFNVNGLQTVRFGANGAWIQRTVSNAGQCTNSFFGLDPLVGVTKRCELLSSASPGVPETGNVSVRARASLAANTGPLVQLRVDGVVVGSSEVRSASYEDYPFSTAPIPAGARVDVVFVNDLYINGEDRNLFVESITVNGATIAANTPGVSFDRGEGSGAFDGDDVLPGLPTLYWNGALRFTIASTSAPAPPPPALGSSCSLPNFQANVLARVNQYRVAGSSCGPAGTFAPAPALLWNSLLTQAAEGHSRDMVNRAFFSHTGSDGRNGGQRITATGYIWSGWGENIAAGQTSVNAVVDDWMGSPSHCANLMNAFFVDVGAVCVPGTAATAYGTFWTLNLGRRQ